MKFSKKAWKFVKTKFNAFKNYCGAKFNKAMYSVGEFAETKLGISNDSKLAIFVKKAYATISILLAGGMAVVVKADAAYDVQTKILDVYNNFVLPIGIVVIVVALALLGLITGLGQLWGGRDASSELKENIKKAVLGLLVVSITITGAGAILTTFGISSSKKLQLPQ
ncbi:MAG: hypothetical protein LBV67_06305 [Streptococcaceae bacterium]|jgi:hypothetical protein|nr:hypothetical protein [Streptococcaceae bacterium]